MRKGWIDLQVNGYDGTDFSGENLNAEGAARVCRAILARGAAAFLPTLITCPASVAERNLAIIGEVMGRPEFGGALPGIHLEGPFLSPEPGFAGAHNPRHMRPPDPAYLDRMIAWSGGRVRLLTLAAELDGAAELARHAVSKGITVSIGHSNFGPEHLDLLSEAGATALTHLGNGIPHTIGRHRNPVWAGLGDDRFTAMIIADGQHVPPGLIKVMLRAKGVPRVVVVSDVSSLGGVAPGVYAEPDGPVEVLPAGRVQVQATGYLYGSYANMGQCMDYLRGLGLLSESELQDVGRRNPLRLIGMNE